LTYNFTNRRIYFLEKSPLPLQSMDMRSGILFGDLFAELGKLNNSKGKKLLGKMYIRMKKLAF